jgi:hypothetical protein
MTNPRAPISFNVVKSISIPASNTSRNSLYKRREFER